MASILTSGSGVSLTNSGIANAFSTSLLSIGRNAFRGVSIGLSQSARQLNNAFLSQSQAGSNTLFSLATGPSLTLSGMQTQILGLRASIPISQLSPRMLEELAQAIVEEEAAAERGRNVDIEA